MEIAFNSDALCVYFCFFEMYFCTNIEVIILIVIYHLCFLQIICYGCLRRKSPAKMCSTIENSI